MIGGVIGAQKMKKASKKAMKYQVDYANQGITQQNQALDAIKGYYDPYATAGNQALGQYGNLLGLGGADQQQAAIDQLKNSPFYQSLYRTGEEAVLQNASATGGLRGGNTQRSLADFGADTLMQTIQQQLQSLGGLTEMGYNSAGALSGASQNTADNVTNLLQNIGGYKAGNAITQGNIKAGMWQGLGSGIDQMAKDAAMAIAGGGGFGAMGAGGAQFNWGAAGNQLMGVPGLFGTGAKPAGATSQSGW